MAKSTKYEVKKRINQVSKMLISGVSRADIIQYASENWSITERQTDTYIQRVRTDFEKKSEIIRSEQVGLAISRYNDLYSKNMRIDDYKAALATQKELSNLLGLNSPQRKELTGKDGGAIETKNVGLSDEDKLKRIDELLDRARARRDTDTS